MKTNPDSTSDRPVRRILLLEDHPLTRHGMNQLLNGETDLEVCGEAESAPQALMLVKSLQPDLILSDITLPSKSGLEFIKDMKALYPDVPVLVLSMHDENVFAQRVLRAGARGYVMKTESAQTVLSAVRQVLQGKIYASEKLSLDLFNRFIGGKPSADAEELSDFTDREFEIYQLLGQGLSTVEISRRLCISVKTVETHRIHLKRKLKLNTTTELASHAVRWAAANQLA